LRAETRDACFHHFIERLPGLNAIDLVQRFFRKGGDVKILAREQWFWAKRPVVTVLDSGASVSHSREVDN
jgi:hypothetical protein